MNNITILGRLTRDAELKNDFVKFDIASDVGYGNKKTTMFFGCWLHKTRGEKLQQYLVKGTQVCVAGEFKASEYDAKDGTKKTGLSVNVSSVAFAGSKKEESDKPNNKPEYADKGQKTAPSKAQADEDLPF